MSNLTSTNPGTQAAAAEDPLSASSASHASYSAEPIVCTKCGKSSAPQSRFCGDCGVRLWEPCPKCSVATAINRRFCGGCGESLSDSLEQSMSEVEELLVASEQLALKGRFVEAFGMLEGVSLVEHTQLLPLSQRVAIKLEELQQRREDAVSQTQVLTEETKSLNQAGSVRKALAKATEVPEGLRNAELRELIKTLALRVGQADELRKQIKQGLQAKEFEGLAAAAEKLSELEPEDTQVKQLAEQLGAKQAQIDLHTATQLLQKACVALRQCDYGKAGQLLARMPDTELSEKHQEVRRGASERVWLATNLARMQYVDGVAMKLAERFSKLQPQDPKAQALVEMLSKRRREGLKANPGQPIVWRKANADSPLLGSPTELAPMPDSLARYAVGHGLNPAQLSVAYGLGLQALGEAKHALDLTPKKKSWLPALNKKKPRAAAGGSWGIDMGASALKAVKIEREEQGKIVVAQALVIPYDRPGEDRRKPELPFETPAYMTAALDKLMTEHDLSNAGVAISTPGPWTLSRSFRIPMLSDAKFAEAVRYEARMRIPLEPDSVVFDQIVTELPKEDEFDQRAVTLVACAKSHAEAVLRRFESRKVKSLQLTSDCVALLNTLEAIDPSDEPDGAVALVGVGAKTTNIAVRHARGSWVRGLYHGADTYDHLLVKGLQTSWDVAEKQRREPWRGRWLHEGDALLGVAMVELASAVGRYLTQIESEESIQINRVYVCGGGSAQLGLMRRLRLGE